MQTRLEPLKVKYYSEAYNKFNDQEQWIRISDGCPSNCPFCYCPTELKYYGIPKLVRNKVHILDFNLLAQPNIKEILKELSEVRVNNKKISFYCKGGFDKHYVNKEIVSLIKKANIKEIILAWNWNYKDEFLALFDAIKLFLDEGYRRDQIAVYIICNWRISYEECIKKLDVLKVWNIKCFDCYYDNQTFPNVQPIYWTYDKLKAFRRKCRKHNLLILFKGYDPKLTP